MNRRGFISMLAGAAGGILVPWRGLDGPTVFLPPTGGWAARSISELWLDYANRIRPIGITATAVVDASLDTLWALDELLSRGEIVLKVSANVPPSTMRQMRRALLNEPATFHAWPTLGDFAPWEFDPGQRHSYLVERSNDVRRIDNSSSLI